MQQQLKIHLLAFSVVSLVLSVPAAAQTYTAIDYPGAVKTIATGINTADTIVGDFCVICKSGFEVLHGYILSHGTFTQIDFPGAAATRPLGINDGGSIVGYYWFPNQNSRTHGFLYTGGVFISIDFPGANQTHAIGIDRAGDIFGSYCTSGNSCYGHNPAKGVHGYVLSGGAFTTIDVPGANITELWGRGSAGQIAGRYQDAAGLFHVFLLTNSNFTAIDFPGAAETSPGWYSLVGGIDGPGVIASMYCAAEPCSNPSPTTHGFLLSGGTYTKIDFPGAIATGSTGVNSSEYVVGVYFDTVGAGVHGFLRVP